MLYGILFWIATCVRLAPFSIIPSPRTSSEFIFEVDSTVLNPVSVFVETILYIGLFTISSDESWTFPFSSFPDNGFTLTISLSVSGLNSESLKIGFIDLLTSKISP